MLKQFLNHIRTNSLLQPGERALLAVSGGLDSMVMLRLFLQAEIPAGVVHCNFQLRPVEADQEEALVKEECMKAKIPFFQQRFDTLAYADSHKLSIQVAARNLRYSFFEEVRQREGFDAIATAHHLNDSLETFLLNLVRGTGIDGLTGIPVRNGAVIRPLLFASREMIEQYGRENKVKWLEDSSNRKQDYRRNVLRQTVVPVLKKLNPSLESGFASTAAQLKGTKGLASLAVNDFRSRYEHEREGRIYLEKEPVRAHSDPAFLLASCIRRFGFSYEQADTLLADQPPGKIFESRTHRLTVDRVEWIIEPLLQTPEVALPIPAGAKEVRQGHIHLLLELFRAEDYVVRRENEVAQLDFGKLKFPLFWRSWKEGDSFQAFGSGQRKKISDFLIDNKVPLPEKKQVTVIESGGEIVWVVGWRINHKFRITEETKEVMRMTVQKVK